MNFPNQTKHKIIIPAPFLGKMRRKNRFRQIVKIPPTPTTFILSGTFQGVTIHPDFRMIERRAFPKRFVHRANWAMANKRLITVPITARAPISQRVCTTI